MSRSKDRHTVLTALADPTRWGVLKLLAERGDASASTLAKHLPISRPAVIKHLMVLDEAGLVTRYRSKREVRYSAQPYRLAEAGQWMTQVAGGWEQRLARLKQLAEARVKSEPPNG